MILMILSEKRGKSYGWSVMCTATNCVYAVLGINTDRCTGPRLSAILAAQMNIKLAPCRADKESIATPLLDGADRDL
jgi:hypothetical protein